MQYIANPYDTYKKQGVLTASPIELIIMLYDGCIKNIKISMMMLEKKDMEKVHISLTKAQDIMTELITSLDLQYEVGEQLMDIYVFVRNTLVDANLNKEDKELPGLIEVLEELRSAWDEIAKNNRSSAQIAELEAE